MPLGLLNAIKATAAIMIITITAIAAYSRVCIELEPVEVPDVVAGEVLVVPVAEPVVIGAVVLDDDAEETGVSDSQAVMFGTSANPSSKCPVTGFGQLVQCAVLYPHRKSG